MRYYTHTQYDNVNGDDPRYRSGCKDYRTSKEECVDELEELLGVQLSIKMRIKLAYTLTKLEFKELCDTLRSRYTKEFVEGLTSKSNGDDQKRK